MLSELQPNYGSWKHARFFTWQGRKQTVQGECFSNERQLNSLEHEDRSGWQRRKTRLQWLMWLSTQRIGKDIRVSSYFFTRRAADVVSEACFIAMTGDRHDDRSRSVTVMSCMNFNSYASFTIPVLFLKTKFYILYECELCLIFVTTHKLAI